MLSSRLHFNSQESFRASLNDKCYTINNIRDGNFIEATNRKDFLGASFGLSNQYPRSNKPRLANPAEMQKIVLFSDISERTMELVWSTNQTISAPWELK
jgi:hypothetical protein